MSRQCHKRMKKSFTIIVSKYDIFTTNNNMIKERNFQAMKRVYKRFPIALKCKVKIGLSHRVSLTSFI